MSVVHPTGEDLGMSELQAMKGTIYERNRGSTRIGILYVIHHLILYVKSKRNWGVPALGMKGVTEKTI